VAAASEATFLFMHVVADCSLSPWTFQWQEVLRFLALSVESVLNSFE
jgi:hypothetical protein